jgi:hypothetical protein
MRAHVTNGVGMPDNPIARIKELDKERSQLITTAKNEALVRANAAISDLNALGFNFTLTEEKARAVSGRKGTRQVKAAPCSVCKFETTPPHDARKHRAQGKRKRAFTTAELKELELKKT